MLSLTLHAPSHGLLYVAEEHAAESDERPTVYLDNTIPSFLAPRSRRDPLSVRRQRITQIWWQRYRVRYALRVSLVVSNETSAGDARYARQRTNILKGIEYLKANEHSDELKTRLLRNGVLPSKADADAEHIAIAAAHSMRYLLTWNYKHLANPQIARNVVRTCEQIGLECPEICTPEELMRAYVNA